MKAMTSIGADHRLEQRILSMKPEHETRRKIIREWMSLPKDKRKSRPSPSLEGDGANPIQWRSVPADNEVALAPHR
jgi:hypothetical protein